MPLLACLLAAVVGAATLAPAWGAGPEPTLKTSIALPGVSGRIDHLAYDPMSKRLFVAALENGSLEVIDVDKGERIKSVGGLKEPQGIVYVPNTKQVVVACGGDGLVLAYDAATLDEKRKVKVGEDADNVRLAHDGKTLVVGYSSGGLAILNAETLTKTGEIKLGGHPESFQLEPGTSRIIVNVPGGAIDGGAAVVVADRTTQLVTSKWPLKEAGRNFPMALDGTHKRLYVGCRRPAKMLVLDTDSGAVVASPECVGDADDMFIDPQTERIFVIGGDGAIDVFETGDHGPYAKAASVNTASGARTGLLVSERRALYIAVPSRPGRQSEIREYALPDGAPSKGSKP